MSASKNKIAVVTGGSSGIGVETDISMLGDVDLFHETGAKKGKIDVIFAGAASRGVRW